MKDGDFLWDPALAVCLTLLALPAPHGWIVGTTKLHPFVMAFVKFREKLNAASLPRHSISYIYGCCHRDTDHCGRFRACPMPRGLAHEPRP